MEQNQQPPSPFPNIEDPSAEPFGNDSAKVPANSEELRKPEELSSEKPLSFPKLKPPTIDHTTTVRRAAKMFEAQGHPITERTIINWCYPTKTGQPAKLDCSWDETQTKYFITEQSMDQVMATMPNADSPEEPLPNFQKDANKDSESTPDIQKEDTLGSERFRNDSETPETSSETPDLGEDKGAELRRLRRENFKQAKTIEGSDIVIDQLQKGMNKTVDSFTRALTKTSIQVGKLQAENERLYKLLGDGAKPQDAGVREATTVGPNETVGNEDEEEPNE